MHAAKMHKNYLIKVHVYINNVEVIRGWTCFMFPFKKGKKNYYDRLRWMMDGQWFDYMNGLGNEL